MQTSDKGVAFIAAHEGVVTRAYRDAAGVLTIGVGHTAAAGAPVPVPGMTITRAEAFAILARDLPKYERRVAAALPGLAQPAFDGAVSFDFNTGAIDRASWVTALKAGDIAGARTRLMQWVKAGGRTLAGLVRRREAEARLIFSGDYGDAGPPRATDDVRALQRDLAALGFYRGSIDGIAGPATLAAVLAYQRSHPDLVVDGVAGPATQASLARDVALRKRLTEAAGTVVGGAATAGGAIAAGGGGVALAAGVAAAIVVAVIAWIVISRRYGGELRRLVAPISEGS